MLLWAGVAAFLLIAAEEISWGQRIMDWRWEALQSMNQQGELNFHNLLPLIGDRRPYFATAAFIAGGLPAILFLRRKVWFWDFTLTGSVAFALYVGLPQRDHLYFYEFTETWVYFCLLTAAARYWPPPRPALN